jgi:hypothetical protein
MTDRRTSLSRVHSILPSLLFLRRFRQDLRAEIRPADALVDCPVLLLVVTVEAVEWRNVRESSLKERRKGRRR